MTIHAHSDFEDCLLVKVKIHDLHTGSNWTAKISGTAQDIRRQWLRTERLLAGAGFSLGWKSYGVYRGTTDHLVLVREAVDRCWLERAADPVP